MIINGIEALCTNGSLEEEEMKQYVDRGKSRFGKNLKAIKVTICEDGDDVEIEYIYNTVEFKRLRRITGKRLQ